MPTPEDPTPRETRGWGTTPLRPDDFTPEAGDEARSSEVLYSRGCDKFDAYPGLGQPLTCPRCGNDYLHHDRVDVFERAEDATGGLHVTVESTDRFGAFGNDPARATVDSDLESNPSPRRHGLAVHLWCELCPARPVLTIAQHKGTTYIQIIDPADDPAHRKEHFRISGAERRRS